MPIVSVGIPTYNRLAGLKRATESVLAQDYTPLEIIISDNASTDDTEAFCRTLCVQDSRVKYIRQPHNLGPTPNFKTVLDHATGKFFMWLADDDWLEEIEFVRHCTETLLANPDYSLVGGTIRYHKDYGDKSAYLVPEFNLLANSASERVGSYYKKVNDNGIFYGVARREEMIRAQLTNIMGGDWLTIAAMAFLGKVRMLENVHINRSVREGSFASLAKTLRVPGFHAWNPYVTIAISVFKDIAWGSHIYSTLSPALRFKLGMHCSQIILRYKAVPYIKWVVAGTLKKVLPENYRKFARRIYPKSVVR